MPPSLPRVVVPLGIAQTLAWGSTYYLPAILAKGMAADTGTGTGAVFAAFSGALLLSAEQSIGRGQDATAALDRARQQLREAAAINPKPGPDTLVLEGTAALVEARLAACVNVLGECTSLYSWKGAVETAAEVPVLIKTRESLYVRLEDAIRRLHPYEVPEIIALRVSTGLSAYLDWVLEESGSD